MFYYLLFFYQLQNSTPLSAYVCNQLNLHLSAHSSILSSKRHPSLSVIVRQNSYLRQFYEQKQSEMIKRHLLLSRLRNFQIIAIHSITQIRLQMSLNAMKICSEAA